MTLLQRQRTRSYKTSTVVATGESGALEKRLPDLPLPAGIENIPQTVRTAKTDSKQNGLLKRVGSIFSLRKRPNLDLQLVYSTYNRSPSDLNSLRSSRESEDEIRCPSGLGSAVSIISKRSLPPSPFYPPNGSPYDPMCSQSRLLKRAISTPNLLRSFSLRVKGKKNRRRGASVLADKREPETNSTRRSVSTSGFRLPEIIISLILAQLSQSDIASCATISRTFASAARSALYSDIDTSSIDVTMLEKLTSILSSQSQLAELVTSFTCPEWPPFFVSAKEQGTHGIRQRDTRLTAMFTLALERMYNLTSLTLPSFDASFVAHHTSFGLKSITFLDYMMSEAETKALFAWLDGQVNISTLRFPNLFDIENSIGTMKARIKNGSHSPQPAPDSCYLGFGTPNNARTPSPYSTPMPSPSPSILMQNIPPFTSPTLLPNLTILHATPSLVMSLCSHLENSPITRRPLRSVFLNINSTLYNGLRPASLMSTLSGISHLGLRFTSGVDRRSFEKVIGAAGASLGSSTEEDNDDPFVVVEKNGVQSTRRGLLALEISFQTPGEPGRDEVCGLFSMNSIYMTISYFQVLYKSLQASLPRYNSLSSLKFSVQDNTICNDESRPATEEDMVDLWVKTCPTLTSITLFSGTIWTQQGQGGST